MKSFPFTEDEAENQKGSVLPKNTDLKMASRLQEDMESVKRGNRCRWHLRAGLFGIKTGQTISFSLLMLVSLAEIED